MMLEHVSVNQLPSRFLFFLLHESGDLSTSVIAVQIFLFLALCSTTRHSCYSSSHWTSAADDGEIRWRTVASSRDAFFFRMILTSSDIQHSSRSIRHLSVVLFLIVASSICHRRTLTVTLRAFHKTSDG